MAHTTICPTCFKLRPCNCPKTSSISRRHKQAKAKAKGYKTAHWQRIRTQRLRLTPFCADCRSRTDLTVDLVIGQDHSRARINHTVTRCRPCHGRKDGGKHSSA